MGADLGGDLPLDVVVAARQGLDAHLLGLLPHRPPLLVKNSLEISPQRLQTPLVPRELVRLLTVHEAGVVFVDGVVGEVDVVVAQVLHLVGVALRGEPHQPIFKYIKSERLNAGHQDVDADVKLETVYEHWIVDVLLNNHLAILRWNLFCKKCRAEDYFVILALLLPIMLISLMPMPQYQFGGFMMKALFPFSIAFSSSALSSGNTNVLAWKLKW